MSPSTFSWTKSEKFGYWFGSKNTMICCTGSVLFSRFRQAEFTESSLTQGYHLLLKLKLPQVKCEDVKIFTSQGHTSYHSVNICLSESNVREWVGNASFSFLYPSYAVLCRKIGMYGVGHKIQLNGKTVSNTGGS